MRKGTVKKGVKLLIASVSLLIAASFYHDEVADILFLSPPAVEQFVFFAFFWGGMLGGVGIMVVATGLLRSGAQEERIRLAPTLMLLLVAVILFFTLLYRSFVTPEEQPRLRPG